MRQEVAREADARVTREQSRVDDFIITASFTIIAAFAVIITIGKKPEGHAGYIPVAALASLALSLLSGLWHRYRHPIRLRQFEIRNAEITYEYSDKIADFMETFVQPNPAIAAALAAAKVNAEGKTDNPVYKKTRDIIVAHLRNLSQDSNSARESALMKPLDESASRVRHFADVAARRIRYPAFGIGVLLFLFAVGSYLI